MFTKFIMLKIPLKVLMVADTYTCLHVYIYMSTFHIKLRELFGKKVLFYRKTTSNLHVILRVDKRNKSMYRNSGSVKLADIYINKNKISVS